MKILLLGSNGQLGLELQKFLKSSGDLICSTRDDIDLANVDGIRTFIEFHQPDVLINAAAYTAVDKAESEKNLAFAINAQAVGEIAKLSKRLGFLFIHYSTDYVFDGSANKPRTETDLCRPLNVYGQSKRAGEIRIIESGCKYLIFRTSWVYSAQGHNFIKTILRLAEEKTEINVVYDQIGTPTSTRLISSVTSKVLQELSSGTLKASGIYHLTASGSTSWYEFAKLIVAEARKYRPGLSLMPENIMPIPSSAYPVAAKRPDYSTLSTSKLSQKIDTSFEDWRIDVKLITKKILQ